MAQDQITQNLLFQRHNVLKEHRDRLHHRTLTHTALSFTASQTGLLCPAEYLLIRFVGGLDLEFVFQAIIDLPEVLHRGLKVHAQILAAGCHCQPRVVWDSWRMEGGATFMAIVEEHTRQDKVLTRHHR